MILGKQLTFFWTASLLDEAMTSLVLFFPSLLAARLMLVWSFTMSIFLKGLLAFGAFPGAFRGALLETFFWVLGLVKVSWGIISCSVFMSARALCGLELRRPQQLVSMKCFF